VQFNANHFLKRGVAAKCLMQPRLLAQKIFSATGALAPLSAPNSFHSLEMIRKTREAPAAQAF
jgi:hypothetical protein